MTNGFRGWVLRWKLFRGAWALLLDSVAWLGFQAVSAKWRTWTVQRQPRAHHCLKLKLLTFILKFSNTKVSFQLALALPDITHGERNLCENKREKRSFPFMGFNNLVWFLLWYLQHKIFSMKFLFNCLSSLFFFLILNQIPVPWVHWSSSKSWIETFGKGCCFCVCL